MNLLETTIRLLIEKAITAEEASVAELAVYEASPPKTGAFGNADHVYILYSPKLFVKKLKGESVDQIVQGVISLFDHSGECNNASSVLNVAATKGYGPLMYNIAGSNRQITAHREKGGVKSGARNIWNHFYTKGGAETFPFDDKDNPQDDDPANDCKLHGDLPLDHSYAISGGGAGGLTSAHSQFMSAAKSMGVDPAQIPEALEKMANEFYMDKFFSSMFG